MSLMKSYGKFLSRLHVPPLLRFRCVSKSWKGLIDSNQFIKEHLNHSRKTNSSLKIILGNCHLYSADFDLLNKTNRANFQELTHPLKTPFGGNEILGSCDGLLVINDEDDNTILWNPTIRRFHELPFNGIECLEYFTSCHRIVYGFGYDVVSDDYKLVRIVQFDGKGNDDFDSEVNVYSLKSDSWRRIAHFPYYLQDSWWCNGEFPSGALHWIVCMKRYPGTDRLVAAFDLGTVEYILVLLPKFPGNDYFWSLGVLGGCLSIICEYEDHVDIWVMKEYGVQESWSNLFTYDKCYARCDLFSLIAYSKCGRKVLLRLDERVLMMVKLDS